MKNKRHYNHCVIGLKHEETGEYDYFYERFDSCVNLAKIYQNGKWKLDSLDIHATKKRCEEIAIIRNNCMIINGNSKYNDFDIQWKYNNDNWKDTPVLCNKLKIYLGYCTEITFDLEKLSNKFVEYWNSLEKTAGTYLTETLASYILDEIGSVGIMDFADNFRDYKCYTKYSDTDGLQFDFDSYERNNDDKIAFTLIECLYDYIVNDKKLVA